MSLQFSDSPHKYTDNSNQNRTPGAIVWVLNKREEIDGRGVYSIQGVFSSEYLAVASCVDETYFIFQLPLDVALPHERVEAVGNYFPLASQSE